MSAPYPNATILPHPALTAAAAEQVCRENNLQFIQDGRGRLELVPKGTPRVIRRLRLGSLDPDPEAA